jgi:beta-glucosidase
MYCAPKSLIPAIASLLLAACQSDVAAPDYRDLNKNDSLDIYEDSAQATESRISDLLGQMTIEEKAGMMFIYRAIVNDDGTIEYRPGTGELRHDAVTNIVDHKMNHFNLWGVPEDPVMIARWYNTLQKYAEEQTRLGIPITIASDPRHHFSRNIFSFESKGFSQFPETLGLAAIGDADLVARFADIVREEYIAVGIRLALHPQLDLATEPRWARINGGFGADAELNADLGAAYVRGLQGNTLSSSSVATMTKHFPGGGPQREGLDPHFAFHKGQIYPGDNFDYHLIPFAAAINAGTAAIMPYYGVPTGQTDAEVGMAFNKSIIDGLLRKRFAFDGVICTDWGVITDISLGEVLWPARAWGVEHLSEKQRVNAALEAGVDQFGGERCPQHVVSLVNDGTLSEQRLDESLRRILRQKFELGLFDHPFVDESQVNSTIGREAARELGFQSQMHAMTLLKNSTSESGQLLPLNTGELKVYLAGMSPGSIEDFAVTVESPEDADVAILRVDTPWYPVDTPNPFARGFHHGDLDFKDEEKQRILEIMDAVPTVLVIYLDRPAVIPQLAARAAAVVADYGANDRAVANVLFGRARPEGRLPFELPSSMTAVRNQKADLPDDSEDPLFEAGFGLAYE